MRGCPGQRSAKVCQCRDGLRDPVSRLYYQKATRLLVNDPDFKAPPLDGDSQDIGSPE